MSFHKKCLGLLATGASCAVLYACAAKDPPSETGLFPQNGGGFANGTGSGSAPGSGNTFGSGNSTNLGAGGGVFFGASGGAAGNRNNADACPAIHEKPETITVYKDATVTDTIYTSKPVALFIMQDRSSSMVGVTGDPNSWPNSTAAVTAFVNDPKTAGIDIALGVFPPISPSDIVNQGDCAGGADCGTMVVPWGPLPANGPAMINGYNTASPNANCPLVCLTPTECALRGMINNCLQFMARSTTGEQCVAILVTDGAPTTCNTDHNALTQIVADGHANSVITYALGLPGADIGFLDQLATAGGTGKSIDLTSGNAQTFIDALNNIRQTVAVTQTQHISTPMVISTPLPCEWKIPQPKPPTVFDKTKVNVQFVPPGGVPPIDFGNVGSQADCARAPGDAWYYDNNDAPTKVLACPNSCNGTLHNSPGSQVDIIFGCDTVIAVPH